MPSKPTTRKKGSVEVPPHYPDTSLPVPAKRTLNWKIGLIVLSVIFVALLSVNRGWLVAAVVNGKPIFSWELNNSLRDRYGEQTLEGLIGEQLIESEARSQGVVVTETEVDAKQQEVLSSLGENVNLEEFLQFQGMTIADFRHQLRVQLLVERLLTRDLTVTDEDIDEYIASNAAMLTATAPAELREEARQAIVNNAVSEKLQSWFSELRQKASVMKFL